MPKDDEREEDLYPVWKRIYQVITGNNQNVVPGVLDEVLSICHIYLQNVLLDFKCYTKESYDEWRKASKSLSLAQDDEMCSFVHRVSQELDLDVSLAWYVICNYLIFEYYGKVSELKSIIRYETNTKYLIEDLWIFYSSDRMFLLKSLRFILEKMFDRSHPFYEKYITYVKGVNLSHLWEQLLASFKSLLNEIDADKCSRVTQETLAEWIQRNNREQVEILLIMIQVCDMLTIKGNELLDVLKLFLYHGFGRHPAYLAASLISRPKDITDIMNAEIGLTLAIIYKYIVDPANFKLLPAEIETEMQKCQLQGDNCTILFIWLVGKSVLSDNINNCKDGFVLTTQKEVFKTYANCITSNMFQGNKSGYIVAKATLCIIEKFLKFVDDPGFIFEQKGFVELICELYKNPNINAVESLGIFLQMGFDSFPHKMENFLDMAEALILNKQYYDKMLEILHNFKTYCTDMSWPYIADFTRSNENILFIIGSHRYIIPAGTLLEKFKCFGRDVVRFHYNFDFFETIEQFMRSLTKLALNSGQYESFTFNYVKRSYKFLNCLISNYKGDIKNDNFIRLPVKRLNSVPTYYNHHGLRNYDFFYTYFKANCSLVKLHNIEFKEAFPDEISGLLFPSVAGYINVIEELKLLQTTSRSVLYSFLKEEQGLKNHKLLIEYIELVLNLLQKDILHEEVIYSGIWYVLYLVFPIHVKWDYSDGEEFQQYLLLNGCLRIFNKVLQRTPEEYYRPVQKQIYDLVQKAFIQNSYIIDTLYNIFVKDKHHLSNLMNQETNWNTGGTLIVLESEKLQLILLILVFKRRAVIPNEKYAIDDRIDVFAKHASSYFIKRYNSTLAVLGGRLLDILARDKNIPLLSCLQADFDQIQTLFLERLRDPMEDENVKANILDLISSCIFHQTGMTSAFFNVETSKKWYNPDVRRLQIDTVAAFMIDYLNNIKESASYLRNRLQIGILKVMSSLWECQKQHLIRNITSMDNFWELLVDPFLKSFDQAPLIYVLVFKIVSIELIISNRKPDEHANFFKAVEKCLTNENQLRLFQQYILKVVCTKPSAKHTLRERELLLVTWTEVILTVHKQSKVKKFPSIESQFLFIELAFNGVRKELVHQRILIIWLRYMLVVIDVFGLRFEKKMSALSNHAISFAKIIKLYYKNMPVNNKCITLTIILKIIQQLEPYYKDRPDQLNDFLEEIACLVDTEHLILGENVWMKFLSEDPAAKSYLCPWVLIISIANCVLSFNDCSEFAIWFSNRKYIDNVTSCIYHLLPQRSGLSSATVALHSLVLYLNSSLADDFTKVNISRFFDKIEPKIIALLTGQSYKLHVLEQKEEWLVLTMLLRFNEAYIKKFQKAALEACYTFLSINSHVMDQIMALPESTVDFRALDLLLQTLKFYYQILKNWKSDWSSCNPKTYSFVADGIRRVINSCIYLCLRPKHIGFYSLDIYHRLIPADRDSINELMISVINRLIEILTMAFKCLYKMNASLIELFNYYPPEEGITVLIENDFSVPRFQLPIPYELTYGKLLCLAHFFCKTLNQIYHNEEQTLEINEIKYLYYAGLVENQDPREQMPNQKLSSFLRYLYEYSGLIDPWINNLHYENTRQAADTLMMFIAQQAFLTLKILPPAQVPYYKRNLSSELQFFQEYIKKHTLELISADSSSSLQNLTSDIDHIKRYLLFHWKKDENGKNKIEKVAEENFMMMLSFWFSNICQIQ